MARKRVNGSEKQPLESDNVVRNDETGIDGETELFREETGTPVIEPETVIGEPDSGDSTKRRGRPKGSRNTSSKNQKQTADDLTGILLSMHMMLEALTKVPEFEISKDEAEKLAAALARVSAYYGHIILPEKYACWLNLAIVGGHVYGPRYFAFKLRTAREAEEKKRHPQPVTIDAPIARPI